MVGVGPLGTAAPQPNRYNIMKNLLLLLFAVAAFIFVVSGKFIFYVDLSVLPKAASVEVLSYEKSGIKVLNSINNKSELSHLVAFLQKENLKIDPAGFDIPPPLWSAHFKDSSGKTLFIIWLGQNWIGSQDESRSHGTEKWELDKIGINKIRKIFKLNEL